MLAEIILRHRRRSCILARRRLPEQHGGKRGPTLSQVVRGAVHHHLVFPSTTHGAPPFPNSPGCQRRSGISRSATASPSWSPCCWSQW